MGFYGLWYSNFSLYTLDLILHAKALILANALSDILQHF
uniref:Uncharacterized protein n=1 Tax=Anguilla anguilla TaxID=7936 RepID=A0A0E9U399_ANGAN